MFVNGCKAYHVLDATLVKLQSFVVLSFWTSVEMLNLLLLDLFHPFRANFFLFSTIDEIKGSPRSVLHEKWRAQSANIFMDFAAALIGHTLMFT